MSDGKLSLHQKISLALCLICAVTLQTQVTLFSSETYLGLRINATDLVVPFAGIAILYTLLTKQSRWPAWSLAHAYPWLAGLSAILLASLAHSYILYGSLSEWALVNKTLGWFILVSIFAMGGWIGANASQTDLSRFFSVLIFALLLLLSLQAIYMTLTAYGIAPSHITEDIYIYFPISGLMANRNAHGLFFITGMTYALFLYFSYGGKLYTAFVHSFCFLIPFFVVYNGSRASILALVVIVPVILYNHRQRIGMMTRPFLFLLLGLAAISIITLTGKDIRTFLTHNPADVLKVGADAKTFSEFTELGKESDYSGDSMRLTILQDAWEQIQDNPVFGSGLGSALLYQAQKHGRSINLIDSTPIWILVEMGIVGLIVFAAFCILAFRALCLSACRANKFEKTIITATCFVIAAAAIMCLFHEILYTRHMWFLAGLALALPIRRHQGG